jgi:FkbM family methyltransferase
MRTQLIRLLRPYWFRGKGRILNALYPSEGIFQEKIYDSIFELDLQDHIQRNVFLGVYEPKETQLLMSLLKPGMTFVDVGANIGYFSSLASKLVGKDGKVYAFEPSPYAFQRLVKMVESSSVKNIYPLPFALSDSPGTLRLPVPAPGNHTPSLLDKNAPNTIAVQVETLDHCLRANGVSRVNLLKVDVEGFELKALAGAESFFREGAIENVVCEFNEYWLNEAGTSSEELYEFFLQRNFMCVNSKPKFQKMGVENLHFQRK